MATEAPRYFKRGGQAVALDFFGADLKQTPRFSGVGSEYGRCGAFLQQLLQARFGANQVQRVGIQHQRQFYLECGSKKVLRFIRLPQARSNRQAIEMIEFKQIFGCTQHEFRLHRINQRRVFGEEGDISPAGAQLQRRAAREQRRANHASCTAKYACVAKHSFVAAGEARLELRASCL